MSENLKALRNISNSQGSVIKQLESMTYQPRPGSGSIHGTSKASVTDNLGDFANSAAQAIIGMGTSAASMFYDGEEAAGVIAKGNSMAQSLEGNYSDESKAIQRDNQYYTQLREADIARRVQSGELTSTQASIESLKGGFNNRIDWSRGAGSIIPSVAAVTAASLAGPVGTYAALGAMGGIEANEARSTVLSKFYEKDEGGNFSITKEDIANSAAGQKFMAENPLASDKEIRDAVSSTAGMDAATDPMNLLASVGQVVSDKLSSGLFRGAGKIGTAVKSAPVEAFSEGGMSAASESSSYRATKEFTGEQYANLSETYTAAMSGLGGTGAMTGIGVGSGVVIKTGKGINGIRKALRDRNLPENPSTPEELSQQSIDASTGLRDNFAPIEGLSDEQNAQLQASVNSMADMMEFDATALNQEGIPEVLKTTLGGARNTMEVINNLSEYLDQDVESQSPKDRLIAASALNDFLLQVSSVMEQNAESVGNVPTDSPLGASIAQYQEFVNGLGFSPAILNSKAAAVTAAQNANIQKITPENINTPEGKESLDQVMMQASLSPESVDIDSLNTILDHASDGRIDLPSEQVQALTAVRDLINSSNKWIASLGKNLSDVDAVSQEIRTLDGEGSKGLSAKELFVNVQNAVKLGNAAAAEFHMMKLKNLTETLQNKLAAINESKANGKKKVAYTAYNAKTGETFQNEVNYNSSGKGQQFADSVAADAQYLADVYSGLVTAYGDMGQGTVKAAKPAAKAEPVKETEAPAKPKAAEVTPEPVKEPVSEATVETSNVVITKGATKHNYEVKGNDDSGYEVTRVDSKGNRFPTRKGGNAYDIVMAKFFGSDKQVPSKKGFALSGTTAHNKKDQGKADLANAYIGFGNKGSSTAAYEADATKAGIPVNGQIDPDQNTVAFVSVNGRGQASESTIKDTVSAAKDVLKAGGTVIMDNPGTERGQANSTYNISGEGKVQAALGKSDGQTSAGYSYWGNNPESSDTPSTPEQASTPETPQKLVTEPQTYKLATGVITVNPNGSMTYKNGNPVEEGSTVYNSAMLRNDQENGLLQRGTYNGSQVFLLSTGDLVNSKGKVLNYQNEQLADAMATLKPIKASRAGNNITSKKGAPKPAKKDSVDETPTEKPKTVEKVEVVGTPNGTVVNDTTQTTEEDSFTPSEEGPTVPVKKKVEEETVSEETDPLKAAYPGLKPYSFRGKEMAPRFFEAYKLIDGSSKLVEADSAFEYMREKLINHRDSDFLNQFFGKGEAADQIKAMMNKMLAQAIQADKIKKNKGKNKGIEANPYLTEGQVLNLANQDENGNWVFDDKLTEIAITAAIGWLQRSPRLNSVRDVSDAAGFFGVPESNVTEKMLRVAQENLSTNSIVEGMSREIMRYWGVTGNSDAGIGLVDGTAMAMSKHIIEAMLTKEVAVLGKTVSDGSISQDPLARYVVNEKASVHVFTLDSNLKEGFLAAYEADSIEDFSVSEKEVFYAFGDETVPSRGSVIGHPQTKITGKMKKAQAKAQEVQFYTNPRQLAVVERIGLEGLDIIYGSGYAELPENLNVNHKESLIGKRQQIHGTYKELQVLLGKIKDNTPEGADTKNTGFRLPFVYTVVNRLQAVGRYNPQASTLMRSIFLPSMGTYDLSDSTSPVTQNFFRAAAQGLGVKVEKRSMEQILQDVSDLILNEDGKMYDLFEYFNEVSTDESMVLDPLVIKQLHDDAGVDGNPHVMQTLLDLSAYYNATDADRKNFETGLYLEADGISNGPVSARLTLGAELNQEFVDFMARGGILIGTRGTYQEVVNKDPNYVDNYGSGSKKATTYISNMMDSYRQQLNNGVKGADKPIVMANEVFNVLSTLTGGDITFDGTNVVVSRGAFKNRMTVSLYGAGETGIAGKIQQLIADTVYEHYSEISTKLVESGDRGQEAWSKEWAKIIYGNDNPESLKLFNEFSYSLASIMQHKVYLGEDNESGDMAYVKTNTNEYGKAKRAANIPIDPYKMNNFTMDEYAVSVMTSNIKEYLVGPMVGAIATEMGSAYSASKAIQEMTNLQSTLVSAFFMDRFEEKTSKKSKADKKPAYDGLTQKELDQIYETMYQMFPTMELDGIIHTFKKTGKVGTTAGEYGQSLFERFDTDNSTRAPKSLGVGGAPNLIIGSGDGNTIVKYLSAMKETNRILAIYDGINIPIDEVQQQGEAVNKGVADLIKANMLGDLVSNFEVMRDTILKGTVDGKPVSLESLEDVNLSVTSEIYLLVENHPEIFIDALFADFEVKGQTIDTGKIIGRIIRNLGSVEYLRARADNARKVHDAMIEVGYTSDQYSGTGNPHSTKEGLPSGDSMLTTGQSLKVLKEAAEKQQEADRESPKVELPEYISSLTTEGEYGTAKLYKTGLAKLIKKVKELNKDPKVSNLMDLLSKQFPIDSGVVVHYGTRKDLREFLEDTEADLSKGTVNRLDDSSNSNGWYDPHNNTLYIITDSAAAAKKDGLLEVTTHELLHLGTSAKVAEYFKSGYGNLTEVEIQAMEDIENLIPSIVELGMDGLDGDVKFLVENHLANYDSKSDVDQYVALNELIAYGMSGGETTRLLERIKKNRLAASKIDKESDSFKEKMGFLTALAKLSRRLGSFINKLLGISDKTALGRLTFATSIIMGPPAATSRGVVSRALLDHAAPTSNPRITAFNNKLIALSDHIENGVERIEQAATIATRSVEIERMNTAASALVSRGFNLNPQEQTTLKMAIASFSADIKMNNNSQHRMSEYYDHFLKNLTRDSFLAGIENPTQEDKYIADHKFEVITGEHINTVDKDGRSLLMPVFAAMSVVSEEFRQVLSAMPPLEKGKTENIGIDGKIDEFGFNALDRLTKIAAGEGKTLKMEVAMENLFHSMLDSANETPGLISSVSDKGAAGLERANKYIADKLEDFAAPIAAQGSKMSGSSNEAISGLGKFIEFGGTALKAREGNIVGESIISAANTLNVPDYIKKPITDIIGRTGENKDIYDMVKKVRDAIHRNRQNYRERAPGVIANEFKGTISDDNWTSLYKGLGKTDLASLMSTKGLKMSATEIAALIQDKKAINKMIADLETKVPRNKLGKAKQLANFMNTGVAGNMLLRNAQAIIKYNTKKYTQAEIQSMDALVSLYALRDSEHYDRLSKLTGENVEGVKFTLNYLNGLNKGENDKVNFLPIRNGYFNRYKGYMPSEATAPGQVIVEATKDRRRLERLGYTWVGNYTGSSLDGDRTPRSYYTTEVNTRAGFNQGIVQNAQESYFGVDSKGGITIHGHTAGLITDPQTVHRITKNSGKETGNESLMPVFDAMGNVIAYERSMDPKMVALLKEDTHLPRMLGVWKGRQVEEIAVKSVNEALVDNLHKMWKSNPGRKAEYVNLLDEKYLAANPLVKDAVGIMSKDTIDYAKSVFDGKFLVRSDMVQDVIGYRGISIGEAWTMDTDSKTKTIIRQGAEAILGEGAYKMLLKAESIGENLVAEAKTNIVVRSMIVPAINVLSSMYVVMSVGVSPTDMLKGIRDKTIEAEKYTQGMIQEVELEARILAEDNLPKKRKLEARLENLRDGYKRMSIWPLIERGEFSSVVDPTVTREELMLPQGKMSEYIGAQIDKMPKDLQGVASNLIITKDTSLFKGLQKSVEYGDFIAKAVVYDHMIKTGKGKEYAEGVITELFINYDVLPGRVRGKLERAGMLWFWNYKVRSVKLAIWMMRERPLSSLISAGLPGIPGIGSAGVPLTDNIIYKAVEGTMGNSIGPGQGLGTIALHPWYALMN